MSKQRKYLRKFYCKYHNMFLTVKYILTKKENRCWNCKYFMRINNYKEDHEY